MESLDIPGPTEIALRMKADLAEKKNAVHQLIHTVLTSAKCEKSIFENEYLHCSVDIISSNKILIGFRLKDGYRILLTSVLHTEFQILNELRYTNCMYYGDHMSRWVTLT